MKESRPELTTLLRDALSTAPEELLLPTSELRDSARHSVKYFLDPLAKQYSTVFKQGIYLDGLDSLQIWEQTRLVLDGVADKVLYEKYTAITGGEESGDDELEKIAKRRKLTGTGEDDDEEEEVVEKDSDISDDSDDQDEFEEAIDERQERSQSQDQMDIDNNEDEAEEFAESDVDDGEEGDVQIHDIASVDDEEEHQEYDANHGNYDDSDDGDGNEDDGQSEEDGEHDNFVKDVHGLNSAFFNIEEFNRMTEEAEQSNFLDDDDDEEDIDYFADPDELSGSLEKNKSRKVEDNYGSFEDSEDYDEDDIEGTFGSINNQKDDDNANDIRYEDFFAPPPGSRRRKRENKSSKNKKFQNDDFEGLGDEFDDDNLELALDGLKKDLFAEDDADKDESDVEDGQTLSTFTKMQRKLNAKIAQLEVENVAKKDWALMGEAKARDRPLNSLLEEDLEFDRGTKPVPVITQEVTESLDTMIRNRIKNNDFNDILRRNPDGITEFRPSKLIDVDQTKSSKSLAEIYEEEHLREVDPGSHPTVQDTKLKQAHQEIEELFGDITYKLDALSSWHFTPKPAKPSISIVANASAISMEDAQPIAMSTENMLAPQEVYIPLSGIAKDEQKKEVIRGDGLPVARAEMTRDERKRRRRREKARHAKQEAKRLETRKVKSQTEGSRASVMETLKKGHVTVIGKQGEKRDIEGRLKADKAGLRGSSGLKL
ncbi:Mpp10 protein-domain-containing protein [Lipomyces chichibuensis]|uniref:Mpp10 protein-domain-containing protein n=1 Tax=Lipomyces chichibuensis TaxID=1546026 RepID=UPI0033432E2E